MPSKFGVSYTLSTVTIPSLLALPSATTAHHTFLHLQSLSILNLRALSTLSAGSLLLGYILSPRYAQHPYLLWTALTVGISAGTDLWLSQDARKLLARDRRRAGSDSSASSSGGDALGADVPSANGEEVKNGMERFQVAQAARAGIAGLGFLMSVVGIWGDGF
ncbi:MAG: hypothetical protein M1815_004331 [Lichina confinis]|nr:MAG: hypothetical protein M1815_004331 [Lichina confinis]